MGLALEIENDGGKLSLGGRFVVLLGWDEEKVCRKEEERDERKRGKCK